MRNARRGRRKPKGLLLVLTAVLVLAACGGEPGGEEAEDGGTSSPTTEAGSEDEGSTSGPEGEVVVAQSSDILTLDPSTDSSPISLNVFKHVFDQLTDIEADGSVGELLAESWEPNEDATEWTFTIRQDATFHNGEPVTADDVVFSYEKVKGDESSPVNVYLAAMDSIEKVDDYTVRFTLNQPFAPWDRQTSLVSILPQAHYEEVGSDAFSQEPVGSGAFRFVEWVRDDRLVVEANTEYWGDIPSVERVIFRPVPSESARVAGLESGELDIVPLLPPSEVPRMQEADGVRVELVDSNRILYVGFNIQNPKLDDPNLRRAIDHAIDRQAITENLLGGLGKPEGQVVAPVTNGYDDGIEATEYDPDLARELLEDSDYDGEPLVLQYPNNRYAFGVEVVEAVAGFLSEVGINVELDGMEYSAFFPLWASNELSEMHLFAYGPSIMDAELPLGSLFQTGSKGYIDNPDIDELVVAQRAAADADERQSIISEVWEWNKENVAYSVLYNEVQAYGVNENVDWQPRPDERLFMHTATVNK